MSFFKPPRGGSPETPKPPEPDNQIPVTVIDLSKRYDIYCYMQNEDRLYEDVKVVGIKAFQPQRNQYAVIGGYIEIEAHDGTRMMIPHIRINMICEHGLQPPYKVLRVRNLSDSDSS